MANMLLVFLFLVGVAATQVGSKSVTTSVLRHSRMTRENKIVHEVANGEMTVDYRQAIKSEGHRWPGGKIPFKISPEMETIRNKIEEAVRYWNENTCVKLSEEPNVAADVRHLLLKATGPSCNTMAVGYEEKAEPEQLVALPEDGCWFVSTIAHELGHSIGLYHEQSRSDFSQAVKIYFENMEGNKEDNFKPETDITSFDLPFDYGSLMEYAPDAFSKNARLTLVPKDPLAIALMGQTRSPDFQDYELVNDMYKCNEKCSEGHECSNGGYPAWNELKACRCMCPPGWTGGSCEQEAPAEKPCLFNVTSSPYALTSPHFPETAGASVGCAWMVTPPAGMGVEVKFKSFFMTIRGDTVHCNHDHLRVRSGDLQSDDPGQMYCGQELENKGFKIDGPILMEFRTDTFTSWPRNFDGEITFVDV